MTENPMLPPADLISEEALIGGSMIHGEYLEAALEIVKPEHFSSGSCRRVFEAICQLHSAGDAVDITTVGSWMNSKNTLQSIGQDAITGMRWLIHIGDHIQSVDAESAKVSARSVRDRWVLRRVLDVAQRVTAECYLGRSRAGGHIEDASAYAAKVSSELADVSEGAARDTLISLRDATKLAFQKVKAAAENGGMVGITTGIEELDKVTGGLQPSDLIVIAGRPGMGKSALAFGIGLSVAKAGHGFVGFSLEMPDEQVALRAVCITGETSLWRARSAPAELTKEDWGGLVRGATENAKLAYWIEPKSGITVPEIRAGVRRVKRECEKRGVTLKVVVVDYIQLAQAPGIDSREQQIGYITRSLKELAKSESVTVIALSQLNRAVEQRGDKRPMMSDLRESGSIEQDADSIVFVYRDDYYNADSHVKGVTELILAKQRNGPTCTVHAAWVAKTVSFRDMTDAERKAARLDEDGGRD